MAVAECDVEDPFSKPMSAWHSRVSLIKALNEACPLEEYMNGNNDLAVCKDIHNNNNTVGLVLIA